MQNILKTCSRHNYTSSCITTIPYGNGNIAMQIVDLMIKTNELESIQHFMYIRTDLCCNL